MRSGGWSQSLRGIFSKWLGCETESCDAALMKSAAIGSMWRGIACILALAFLLLSVSCRSTRNSARDSREGPRPIAVLLYTSVWDVGQSTPRLAVYENGQVILTAWREEGIQNRAFWLSAAQLESLRKQVHELAVLKPQHSYQALDDNHMVMDASYAKIYVRDGRHEAAVSVYALEHVLLDREMRIKLRPYENGGPPPQFMSLYHRLGALAETQPPLARVWTPQKIEVRLRDDHKYLNSKPVKWPKGWPTLNSFSAHAHGDHAWNVLLDGSELPQLRRLMPFRMSYTAVQMNGKIWAACWRPILPGESGWWTAMMSFRR